MSGFQMLLKAFLTDGLLSFLHLLVLVVVVSYFMALDPGWPGFTLPTVILPVDACLGHRYLHHARFLSVFSFFVLHYL